MTPYSISLVLVRVALLSKRMKSEIVDAGDVAIGGERLDGVLVAW